jgi:hypothetical protein
VRRLTDEEIKALARDHNNNESRAAAAPPLSEAKRESQDHRDCLDCALISIGSKPPETIDLEDDAPPSRAPEVDEDDAPPSPRRPEPKFEQPSLL